MQRKLLSVSKIIDHWWWYHTFWLIHVTNNIDPSDRSDPIDRITRGDPWPPWKATTRGCQKSDSHTDVARRARNSDSEGWTTNTFSPRVIILPPHVVVAIVVRPRSSVHWPFAPRSGPPGRIRVVRRWLIDRWVYGVVTFVESRDPDPWVSNRMDLDNDDDHYAVWISLLLVQYWRRDNSVETIHLAVAYPRIVIVTTTTMPIIDTVWHVTTWSIQSQSRPM